MARRTELSSRRTRSPQQRVDVREWLGGVRFSGFMFVMLGLVVLAVFTLLPTIGTYVEQRQRIAALEQAVQVEQDKVDRLTAEKNQWADPAYITTQARERLYYRFPGEVVYLVIDDLAATDVPPEQAPVSDKVEAATDDWMATILRSVVVAGLAKDAVVTPDPAPTPSGTPTPQG